RKLDLLQLVAAALKLKAQDGSYPTTNNQVQTLCKYENLDQGCKFKDYLDNGVPSDPLGDTGLYWYSSDGNTAQFYASLELDLKDPDQPCRTSDAELLQHANLICVTAS